MNPNKSIIKVKCPECGADFQHFLPQRLVRTRRQNSYYWSVVVSIPAQEIGYFPEEMHDAFKIMFLKKHEEGKPETTRSTSSLTTDEFTEYISRCRHWCAEQGIYIPDPEEENGLSNISK